MTNQHNAAQAANQDQVAALQDLRHGVEMNRAYLDDGDIKLAALDAAIDVLSRLRAPAAQGAARVANPHIAYPDLAEAWQKGFNGERPVLRAGSIYLEAFKEGHQAACAALANAPAADNWQQYALPGETTAEQVCERMNAEVTRRTVAAMRANAPVAGDARAEGCDPWHDLRGVPNVTVGEMAHGYRRAFRHLWELINGPGSWKANPWVWVVGFPPLAGAQSHGGGLV